VTTGPYPYQNQGVGAGQYDPQKAEPTKVGLMKTSCLFSILAAADVDSCAGEWREARVESGMEG
jgi:hypothetical protein